MAPDACNADAWEAFHVYLGVKYCATQCGCEGAGLYLLVCAYRLVKANVLSQPVAFAMLGGDRLACEAACLVDMLPGPTLITAVEAV